MEVYRLQNIAIHAARAQLEAACVIMGDGLSEIRRMAGEINDGVESISKLSLEQRRELIGRLIDLGARVKNPQVYESDLRAEAVRAGVKRKVLNFSAVSEKQLRMMDALAGQVNWRSTDGFERVCNKVIKAPRPKNGKEFTAVVAALRSIVKKQEAARAAEV